MKPNYLKKYTDEERKKLVGKCYDCGLSYGVEWWAELIISDEAWEDINPTFHKGAGILCPNCIIRRLYYAGYTDNVPFQFTTGPLSFSCR